MGLDKSQEKQLETELLEVMTKQTAIRTRTQAIVNEIQRFQNEIKARNDEIKGLNEQFILTVGAEQNLRKVLSILNIEFKKEAEPIPLKKEEVKEQK